MENWKNIERKIRANKAQIEENENKARKIPYSKTTEPECAKLYAEAEKLKIENRILHDNARVAYFAENFPKLIEILNRYKGKALGPKTKEKMQAEAREKYSFSFYFDSSKSIEIIPLNEKGYSGATMFKHDDFSIEQRREKIGDSVPGFLDENNKLIEQSTDISKYIIVNCGEYIGNSDGRASEIQTAFNFVKEQHENLEKACSAFNAIIPSGIDYLYAGYFRNYLSV